MYSKINEHCITVADLIATSYYLRPEEKFSLCLHDPESDRDEFKDVDLNCYNLAKYSDYPVENWGTEDDKISIMIRVDND